MKKIYSFILLLFIVFETSAQTPQFWNFNTTGGANAFPFGTTTSRKVQWRFPANSLGSVTAGNNITVVYFFTGNANTVTFPLINISLKQGVPQFSGGGLYETGMTPVYSGTNVVKTGVTNGWMSFTLTTPFTYDPAQVLLIEVEHNNTGAIGPTVHQSSPVGPGFGRLYGNYPNANYAGADQTVAHFGIDVVPNTPCSGNPATHTLLPASFTTCPSYTNPAVTMHTFYPFGGLQYSWQEATQSPVGPYTTVPGATLPAMPVPALGVTTWYQAVVTCTNPGGGSTTLSPVSFVVGGPTSSVVPYHEGFEGIQIANKLPNCSWLASSLGIQNLTSLTAGSGNRLPRTDNGFASFNNATAGTSSYYTNPIQLDAGLTYSAGLWYATEYFGYSNWTNLTILVGPNQSPTGMVPVASVGPAVSGPYKALGGTFTVPSTGQYYVAIRATSSAGSAQFLSFDDLSVTIPCTPASGNSPTVSLSASANTICVGEPVNLNATGATSYSWNNGATGSNISWSPTSNTTAIVTGINAITGCTATQSQYIVVNQTPTVHVVANKTEICPGESAVLTAYGANNYAWSNGGNSNQISVAPTLSSVYTAIGTNILGCASNYSIAIAVKTQPLVTALSLSNPEICAGESVALTANGAASYMWYSSSSSVLYQGSTVNIPLQLTTTFTVVGTGTNSCKGNTTVSQIVEACTGISANQLQTGAVKVFPNPTNGVFTIEMPNAQMNSVELLDISGRLISTTTIGDSKTDIDLSSLASGIYYARIQSDKGSEIVKIIKN